MKCCVLAALVVAAFLVWPREMVRATETLKSKVEFYLDKALREVTKRDAMRALLSDNDATVYRCHQVELSEKVTLRKKRGGS